MKGLGGIVVGVLATLCVLAPLAMAGGNGVGSGGLNGFPTAPSVNGSGISPSSVTTPFVDAGVVTATQVVVTGSGATGIDFTDANGLNRISWGSGRYVNFNATGQFQLTGGADKFLASAQSATCTLDGASPSKCTATVSASARCVCSVIGTGAPPACGVNLVTTTLTAYSANGLTSNVNIWCDR